jgi:hypothetical protein
MDKEIIENGNKIIADFSEYQSDWPYNSKAWSDTLKYHCSWDWLMPVVEKIHLLREVTEVSIRPGSTRIWLKKGSFIQSPIDPHNDSITECWLTVVQFIKSLKKSNDEKCNPS